MANREWEIGICGTFDVANYGDLLFPIIAEAELRDRLGVVKLVPFSYRTKSAPAWPYHVTSITALPQMIHRLDGLLIGGGFLIRFDKDVAPGYGPPLPEIHHPTGYWLTPALIALQNNVPLIWNAPGMHCNDIPQWANPLMEAALTLSPYVAVRDEPSRSAIARLTPKPISVVPDTAFRLPRLVSPEAPPSAAFTCLSEANGLDRPYIVVQATLGLEGFIRWAKDHAERLRGFRFLALPISPVLGERIEIIDADLPGVTYLEEWPNPLLLAELICRSEAVVGHSYHLFITALTSGVPVFTPQDLSSGKYSALKEFDTIYGLPEGDVDSFLSRLGRRPPSESLRAVCETLRAHWDRVADALRAESPTTAPVLNRFWQRLPKALEDAEIREQQVAAALARERQVKTDLSRERQKNAALTQALIDAESRAKEADAQHLGALAGTREQLDGALELTAMRDAAIDDLMTSLSWRWTAPLRFVARAFITRERHIIDLERIRHQRLEVEPYRWAAVNHLFSVRDAAALASTYPRDHFKLVAAHGGEKDYEYEARPLIGMGAETVAYAERLSPSWRALASDLLSPDYRAAITALTRCDLSAALMEVNVFHYGPGASLGAHRDLPEKLVTHVLYFNRAWNREDGGCLSILRSADPTNLVAEIQPIVGNSCLIVRSENSWHAVSRVVNDAACSRRSVTVTFYPPGSVSSMWPADEAHLCTTMQAFDLEALVPSR